MKNDKIDIKGLNEIIALSKKILKVALVVLIVGIVLCSIIVMDRLNIFSFLIGIINVTMPLFIGFVVAWLFYPMQQQLVKNGFNKVFSSLIIFLFIILLIFVFVYMFIPIIYKQLNDLVSLLPSITENISTFFINFSNKFEINGIDIESIKNGIINASEAKLLDFTSSLPNNIVSLVKGLVTFVGTILFGLVIGIYLLIDFESAKEWLKKLLPKKNRNDYLELLQNMNINARRVINGTLLVAFMVFVCDTIGFTTIGLNYSVLFGLLCGITDLIPYIGPYIGGIAAVIIGFAQGPITGILATIIVIVVQLVENYILQPMVMSKATQLNPVVIIIGLLLFGHFFGIFGMIIATPCIAIIKELVLFLRRRFD